MALDQLLPVAAMRLCVDRGRQCPILRTSTWAKLRTIVEIAEEVWGEVGCHRHRAGALAPDPVISLRRAQCQWYRDGRDKPGLHKLKSLCNFGAHHTGTIQWIFVVSAGSLQTFRSARLPSVCGRLVSACTSWLSTAQSGKLKETQLQCRSLKPENLSAARLALVEEHVRLENQHDLEGIMSTFGASARYDEEPWGDHHIGCDAVRAYYDGLLRAMPDLAIEVGYSATSPGMPYSWEVINQWTSSGRVARAAADRPPGANFRFAAAFHLFDAENRAGWREDLLRPRHSAVSARRFPRA